MRAAHESVRTVLCSSRLTARMPAQQLRPLPFVVNRLTHLSHWSPSTFPLQGQRPLRGSQVPRLPAALQVQGLPKRGTRGQMSNEQFQSGNWLFPKIPKRSQLPLASCSHLAREVPPTCQHSAASVYPTFHLSLHQPSTRLHPSLAPLPVPPPSTNLPPTHLMSKGSALGTPQ